MAKQTKVTKREGNRNSKEAEKFFSVRDDDEEITSFEQAQDEDIGRLFAAMESKPRNDSVTKDRKARASTSGYAKRVNEDKIEVNEEIKADADKPTSLQDVIRAEEVAADMVKAKGRYIENVDNVKPGVTFRGADADLYSPEMPLPYSGQVSMRADGVTLDNVGPIDPSEGAQDINTMPKPGDRDDPTSVHFMVCMNSNCRYREGCLRYRMKNKREMKTVFFPEDCRRDGIYISIDDTKFTAYDPMELIEGPVSTPNW